MSEKTDKKVEQKTTEVKVDELKDIKAKLKNTIRQKKFHVIKTPDGIAERTIMLDEETGKGYWALNLEPERVLTVIEVYTNLAVPDEDRYDFYDYLSNEGIITDIWFVIDRDADRVLSLAQNMAKMAIERFNHENSMDNFLKQLSSGSGLGQELTEMLEKAKQQEDTVSQRVSAVLDSKPKGNLINFSKRKK
jgi:hypothetical protein